MSILKWLGLGGESKQERGETDTVRRISAQLDRLEPEDARRLAAFAYVLARVAHVDLHIDESEAREMERLVAEVASLSESEATLVVEIAKSQTRMLGGTENYTVTRQYRQLATPEQRARLLDCLYAVAAADGSISAQEGNEIAAIAEELGFSPSEHSAVRSRWKDRLGVLQGKGDG